MLLLVGLGNPGPRHANNRHNIGFMAGDEIVRRHGLGPWRVRFPGRLAEGRVGAGEMLALEPETYMNETGRAGGGAHMRRARVGRACRMQLAPQQSGVRLRPIAAEIQAQTIAQNRHNNSAQGYRPIGREEWPALRRQLDRRDPSYKT